MWDSREVVALELPENVANPPPIVTDNSSKVTIVHNHEDESFLAIGKEFKRIISLVIIQILSQLMSNAMCEHCKLRRVG